ncbi:hypothetical protein BGX38DRAFT_1264088 [Terfezia claveryi]|nr:hypothetical protein BGX38DRAFT_1264088 [Terfezia claveryi]
MERKKMRKERSKGKGKGKTSAGDTPPVKIQTQEDVETVDEGRFSPYEDLSAYKKEMEIEAKDGAPVTPPVPKHRPLKSRQRNPRLPNTKSQHTKPVNSEEYINMKPFIVHGIPCHRPMADTIQDVKKNRNVGDYGNRFGKSHYVLHPWLVNRMYNWFSYYDIY